MSSTNKREHKDLVGARYHLSVYFPDANLSITNNEESKNDSITDITYTEICRYNTVPLNKKTSRFPERILSMSLSRDDLIKLRNCSIYDSENSESGMMNVELLITPYGKNSGKLLPLRGGKFKASLNQSEFRSSIIKYKSKSTNTMDRNEPLDQEVTLYLFRESELSFGLNTNINFMCKESNLMTIFVYGLLKSNPTMKFLISDFDHNPMVDQFIVPRMGLDDFIEMIDSEFGFYKTQYSLFVDTDTIYFINSDNDLKVTNKQMDYSIIINTLRDPGEENGNKYKHSNDETHFLNPKVPESKIEITSKVNNMFKNEPIYINSSGNMLFNKNSTGRSVDTIQKITDIPHISKYGNIKYEIIKFELRNIGISMVTPLTTIKYTDTQNMIREYRTCMKTTTITSTNTISNVYGYKLIRRRSS